MQAFARQLPRATTTTTTTTVHQASRIAPFRQSPFPPARMSSTVPSAAELSLEATSITTAPGVTLSETQQTLVGSVLDLFAGRPSLAKLGLWADDGEFVDPLTIAQGRKQFEAQWYGLQTAFSEIERQHYAVTGAGNPITLDLTTRYVVKGIGKEQTIASKVNIFTDEAGRRITKVEDKWDGKLPESAIAKAFRRLNANTVPHLVGVPKSAEEDAKRGN